MKSDEIRPGITVQANDAVRLEDAMRGVFVVDRHKQARKPGAIGVVLSYVPGHGGDAWFVQHVRPNGNGDVAVYLYWEIDPIDKSQLFNGTEAWSGGNNDQAEADRIIGTLDQRTVVGR